MWALLGRLASFVVLVNFGWRDELPFGRKHKSFTVAIAVQLIKHEIKRCHEARIEIFVDMRMKVQHKRVLSVYFSFHFIAIKLCSHLAPCSKIEQTVLVL